MKASESNPNYPSKVREMTNYTIREIKKVCKDIGPRPSGEENERKAQDYVADSMSKVADLWSRRNLSFTRRRLWAGCRSM